jgi:hypothetical protein
VAAGVNIVNDGEISKHGLFIGYIRDRMTGFEELSVPASEYRPRNAGVFGRDSRDFRGFYAAGLGGFPVRRLVVPGQGDMLHFVGYSTKSSSAMIAKTLFSGRLHAPRTRLLSTLGVSRP